MAFAGRARYAGAEHEGGSQRLGGRPQGSGRRCPEQGTSATPSIALMPKDPPTLVPVTPLPPKPRPAPHTKPRPKPSLRKKDAATLVPTTPIPVPPEAIGDSDSAEAEGTQKMASLPEHSTPELEEPGYDVVLPSVALPPTLDTHPPVAVRASVQRMSAVAAPEVTTTGNRIVWANRYAIFDEIASGGMATVYVAARLGQVSGGRVFAIKKLFEQFAKQPEFVAMFLDEARLAARIRHPNVIVTYQVLKIPDSLAIVMELVIGVSMVQLLQRCRDRGERMPTPIVGALVVGALRGLHAAHEASDEMGHPFGLVHRDVSPHNILVGKDGRTRVIDFGIAKAVGRLQNTEVGVTKGKFAYMSPEQIRGAAIDRRTDIYAAGVVLWEALVGRRLFQASSDAELLAKRAGTGVPVHGPSLIHATVPVLVDAVVLRALAQDAAARFATAEEMACAVEDALGVASPEEIALWVDRLAHDKLAELEAKVAAVERAYESGELDVAPLAAPPTPGPRLSLLFEAPDLDAPTRSPTQFALGGPHPGSAPPPAPIQGARSDFPPVMPPQGGVAPATRPSFLAPVPDLPIPDRLRLDVPLAEPARTVRPAASAVRTSSMPPAAPPPSRPRVEPLTLAALPSGRSRMATERPGALPAAPSSDASLPVARPLASARSRLWIPLEPGPVRTALIVVASVLVVAFIAKLEGPSLLRAVAVHVAERHGITLAVDSVSLGGTDGGVTLHGTSLRLLGGDELTLRSADVLVTTDWLGTPEKLVVGPSNISVRGDVSSLLRRVERWATTSGSPVAVECASAHLVWPNAIAPHVGFEADGVSFVATAGDDASLHLDATTLTVGVASTSLGPYRLHLDAAAAETKLVVTLDPTKPGGPPSVTLLARPTLGQLFSVNIPPEKLAQVGVPASLLGLGPDPVADVVLEGQVFPMGDTMSAHFKIALLDARMPSLAGPSDATDIRVEGEMGGSVAKPITVDKGTLQIGSVKTRVRGTVVFDHGGMQLEVLQRDRDIPAIVLDTRALTDPHAK